MKVQTRASGEFTDLECARRVLKIESQALEALGNALDGRFIEALDLLSAAQGRVIVTGMGKSGHVGRKIAATLASTGTPAQFVHAGEASHGDLGMVTTNDVILALSNSGETRELDDIIDYTHRYGIPLVAITGEAESTLAQAARVALILPEHEEACSLNLAPTTSTTLCLALGDALAVALLDRRGFSPDDFHAFHPNGRLGTKLLKAEDLMHDGEELPLVKAEIPMSEALITMTGKSFGCIGVLDNAGELAGIITDGDLRRHMGESLLGRTTGDVMTPNPKTVSPETLAAEALLIMNTNKITSLFVTKGNRPVGILHIHDCLRAGVD